MKILARTITFVAFCFLLTSCLQEAGPWTGSGPRVAISGDSLIYGAECGDSYEEEDCTHILTTQLQEDGYSTSLSALVGSTTPDLAYTVWPEPGPEILVLAFGSNDMNKGYSSVEDALNSINLHVDMYSPTCLVLVGITEAHHPDWELDVYGPAWNAALESRADVYVDWATTTYEHPEYLSESDNVHMTPAGREAYRLAIHDGIDQCNLPA